MERKVLNFTVEILILVLVAGFVSDKYYQRSFYKAYLGFAFLGLLVLWLEVTILLKRPPFHPAAATGVGKLALAWTITSVLGSLIHHWILLGFFSGLGSQPRLTIFELIRTWSAGLVLFLAWHSLFRLVTFIFSGGGTPLLRTIAIALGGMLACALVFIVIINLQIRRTYRVSIQSLEAVSPGKAAVVFGAGVYPESGQPSGVLQDRIETAAALYQAGKVAQVLLSGDGADGSLEVEVMEQYALESGIPAAALLLDPLGVRTYATCQQAKHTFGIEDAILVTQRFHLPRALFLCDSLGVPSVGVSADLREYTPLSRASWAVREAVATAYAWLEVMVFNK